MFVPDLNGLKVISREETRTEMPQAHIAAPRKVSQPSNHLLNIAVMHVDCMPCELRGAWWL